jgi:monoamine oxidase
VAVIGAGAAGLYAAHYLITKGIKVTVFEASDRVGGRVRSLRRTETPSPGLIIPTDIRLSNDFPVELGAERILGTDSIWAELVKGRNIPNVVLAGEENDRYILSDVVTNYSGISNDADFLAAKNFYDGLPSYTGANVTVQQAVETAGVDDTYHAILNGWIGAQYGTDNTALSAFALGDGLSQRTRNTSDLVLPEHMMSDALGNVFSRGVQATQLKSVISSIDYSGEKVVLTGQKNGEAFSSEFDQVIITVPISVLKDGDITFNPALPASKTGALSKMEMDPMIRVLLDFKKSFWQNDAADPELRFIFGGTEAQQYFNAGIGRGETRNVLSTTITGSKAQELSAFETNVLTSTLLGELDTWFGGEATKQIRQDESGQEVIVIQDWTKEPFIKGGIAYLKPGGSNADREALGAPIDDKLFFAGEATDVLGEFGTVNGALQSAERAALELIAVITA